MQSTGQTSTHAVSLVLMQGSAIMYAMMMFSFAVWLPNLRAPRGLSETNRRAG
jgi:hypothetical protein